MRRKGQFRQGKRIVEVNISAGGVTMGDPQYMRFPVEEYQARCNKARELMEKENLKGILISDGMNYTYFSGGHGDFSYSRP